MPETGVGIFICDMMGHGVRAALGLFPNAAFTTSRITVESGDLIMPFTDDLFEVEDVKGNLYSQEDLLKAVDQRRDMPTAQLFQQVLAGVQSFSQRSDFDDDVCIVGIEVAHSLSGERGVPEVRENVSEPQEAVVTV